MQAPIGIAAARAIQPDLTRRSRAARAHAKIGITKTSEALTLSTEHRADETGSRLTYFTKLAARPAKPNTQPGKMPRNSVPRAGRIRAAENAGVSGSAFEA